MASNDDLIPTRRYPLPLIIDDDERTPTRGRGRDQGRGGARGVRSRPPSRSRGDSDKGVEKVKRRDETVHKRGGARCSRRGRGTHSGRGGNGDREKQNLDVDIDSVLEPVPAGHRTFQKQQKNDLKSMDLQKLISLSASDEDPNKILFEISHSKSGFWKMIEPTVAPKSAYHVMQVLAVSMQSTDMHILREFLDKLQRGSFLRNLNDLLNNITLRETCYDSIWSNARKLEMFCKNIGEVLKVLMSIIPSSVNKCFGIIGAMKQVYDEHNVDLTIDDVQEVFILVRQEKSKAVRESEVHKIDRVEKESGFVPPPDDFRTVCIFPTLKDLHSDESPFLRANKTHGIYDSADTYLDTHFRLLREDYMRPLREGILEYRKNKSEGRALERSKNIRIYKSVQVLRPVCSAKGVNHIVQFDSSAFKKMNWASSRRLLFGSLVCLSSDNFETVYYATVAERETKHLENGYIELHFETAFDSLKNETFIMAETTAYFEAYRYILEGLQEIREPMPFSSYVIYCQTNIKPPEYLQPEETPCYDFSSLLKDGARQITFPVLKIRQWPSCADLSLDTSQYEALQAAITKELAIIQGPPGTGKTYVGLKIVELLLANIQFWKKGFSKSPILVVCYTNHALDQFLEGILNYCKERDIVRIGGRCKNEALAHFTINNIKKQRKESKTRSFSIMQHERECRDALRRTEKKIMHISAQLRKTTTHLIPLHKLQEFIPVTHCISLKGSSISEWLNFNDVIEDLPSETDSVRMIKREWALFIVEEVEEMPLFLRQSLDTVWHLNLRQRAELYKAWHSECLHPLVSPESSVKSIDASRGIILDFNQLSRHLTSSMSQYQLQNLLCHQNQLVGSTEVVSYWLCALDDDDGITEIRTVIDDYRSGGESSEISADDLEEDRAVDDDDDDDYLFDFTSFEYTQPKRKRTETNSEWVVKWNERKTANQVRSVIREAKTLTDDEEEEMDDIWSLAHRDRCSLYVHWLNKYRHNLKAEVKQMEIEFNSGVESLQEIKDRETIDILERCAVMGMTTTGAAKFRKLLQKVQPQIIIVEEAAEVLESHIITTLNSNCKHLVLIGDHKQLRPSTAVYELCKKYGMDISLFERLVRNNVPCVTLAEQHRMRPEISTLLKHKNLYPNLRDHVNVTKYQPVKGVDTNLQFITHSELELDSKESTSYSNLHEAKYIAALTKYFLDQGYARNQITVLTPYMGQVLLLRKEMPKTIFEGVRITAVDNFQGEENDIILLSLVRSSHVTTARKNPIGFVGIENRICVSLSRAKEGLFVIGNFALLESCSTMWEDIIFDMRHEGRLKKHLVLRCCNHPDEVTHAETPDDFENVPEGGCRRPCGGLLPCGHVCPRICHVMDIEHAESTCCQPCTKIVCKDGHICTKKCYQKCGNCLTRVEKSIPVCGHKAQMFCSSDPSKWHCKEVCKELLPCGHVCKRECFQCSKTGMHKEKCTEVVEKALECGHQVTVNCHVKDESVDCKEPCFTDLDCGHPCSGTCGSCFGGRIHMQCKGSCGKILPCGHKCDYPCTEFCPPCTKQCSWVCSHGRKCTKKCFEPCEIRCTDRCRFTCQHEKCEEDCTEPCTSSPCDKECTKRLNCGHVCRSFCGERCVCVDCNGKRVRNQIGQKFDDNTVFFQLPNCKCIFEVKELDRHMRKPVTSLRGDLSKRCPSCNKIVSSDVRRYSDVLRQAKARIVERYQELRGSHEMRLGKLRELNVKRYKLEKTGLSKDKIAKLRMFLHVSSSEALHTAEKRYNALGELRDIKQEIGSLAITDSLMGMLTIEQLEITILSDRKYISRQFWKEISREIKRLSFGIAMWKLEHKYSSKLSKNSTAGSLVSETKMLLSAVKIEDDTKALIGSVIRTLISYFEGEGNVHLLEAKLDELKSEQTSRPELESDENKRTEKNVASERVSKDQTLDLQLKEDVPFCGVTDEDANASDFTGSIQIE